MKLTEAIIKWITLMWVKIKHLFQIYQWEVCLYGGIHKYS